MFLEGLLNHSSNFNVENNYVGNKVALNFRECESIFPTETWCHIFFFVSYLIPYNF